MSIDITPYSSKRQITEAGIRELAVNNDFQAVTYKEVSKWARRLYRTDLPESQFYSCRNGMVAGARMAGIPVGEVPAQDPPATVVAQEVPAAPDGIVELVERLKEITARIGREQTKRLVDLL